MASLDKVVQHFQEQYPINSTESEQVMSKVQIEKLTQEDMLAAWFARVTDSEARTEGETPEQIIQANTPDEWSERGFDEMFVDVEATKQAIAGEIARYHHGKSILARFKMRSKSLGTSPYMADGSLSPAAGVSDDCAGYTVIEAGHIGASQAYSVLVFVPR